MALQVTIIFQQYSGKDLLYSSNYDFGAGNGTSVSGHVLKEFVRQSENYLGKNTQYNLGIDLGLFRMQ